MGIRRDSAADKEQPRQDALHRENMGSLGHSIWLGGIVSQALNEDGQATVILDPSGYVRFVDAARVTISTPMDEEVTEAMLRAGASDEDIVAALEELDGLRKQWPRRYKKGDQGGPT
jgi:hypothetical protein